MLVKKLIENEDGTVEFTANLAADELQFVVELGINMILAKGSGFFIPKDKEANLVIPPKETMQ